MVTERQATAGSGSTSASVSADPGPSVRQSVFMKLVAILLVMTVSLAVMVLVFFLIIVNPQLNSSHTALTADYARAIAASSPTPEEARRLSARVEVKIRYEGPDGSWATGDAVPTFAEARAMPTTGWARIAGTEVGYVVPAANGGRYLFAWNYGRRAHATHLSLVAILLLLMTAVILLTHVVLRRLLRPLHDLGDGVARLSEGQLDVVLPTETRDEFSVLTHAFNRMVRRVREMVQARDQLLLDVSHELRSPLTRMKVALELVPPGTNRSRMTADVVEMEAMITELLELERLRDGRGIRTTRQDLVPTLRRVAEGFIDRAPGVRLLVPDREIVLDLDGDRVFTVVRNLLENAVKYSLPDSRPVELSVEAREDVVIVRVTDDGPGVPEGDIASLFEPFFRVDRSRSKKTGGYGLGLSICKRVVDAHGGTITVQNNAPRGATFTVTLPRTG